MKSIDPADLMQATIVTHALVRAILNEMGTYTRSRIFADALNYLPLPPDPRNGQPVNEAIWKAAHEELKRAGV